MKKYQLPKEFAEKWIKALRNGEYKKTTGRFTNGKCFCAMGIAHVITGAKPTLIIYSRQSRAKAWALENIQDNTINLLMPMFDEISELNDTGKTFPQIADWIEQNVEFI